MFNVWNVWLHIYALVSLSSVSLGNGMLSIGYQVIAWANDISLSIEPSETASAELTDLYPKHIDSIKTDHKCMSTFSLINVAWWHQTITWASVDLSPVRSSEIHLKAVLKEKTSAINH